MVGTREELSDASSSPSHLRAAEYTYRVPTPPRIVIPPPGLTQDGLPNVNVGRILSADGIDPNFLEGVDFSNLILTNSILDWTYERRREAQKILPFLYLGPMIAAKDREFLKGEGITMLLAVRHRGAFPPKVLSGALQVANEMGLTSDAIDLADNAELIAAFPRAVRVINKHLSDVSRIHDFDSTGASIKGKVLVFCESGNERSAAVVAAYLMEMFDGVDHIKAMQICQAQRFCVSFDDNMKHLLLSYWSILVARRDVAASSTAGNGSLNGASDTTATSSKAGKRRVDTAFEDDEMDMGIDESPQVVDAARFEGRYHAPFQDLAPP